MLQKTKPLFNIEKVFFMIFGCFPKDLAKKIILTPFLHPDRFKLYFEKDSIKDFSGELYKGFTGRFQNQLLSFIRAGIGSPTIGDCLFFLKQARVKEVVFLGSVGGLGKFQIGDLLLVPRASYDKNYSQYFSAHQEYFQSLKNYLYQRVKDSCLYLKEGSVFTLASLFEETRAFLEHLKKLGFSAVDLELAHFYRAAKINKIKAVGLTAISDLPFRKPLGELNKEERNTLFESLNFSATVILKFLTQND